MSDIPGLIEMLKGPHYCDQCCGTITEDGTDGLHYKAAAALAELQATIAGLERELDEASPKQECARCGKTFRWHQMVAEEGDEWECYPCNDRENARERAALAAGEKP